MLLQPDAGKLSAVAAKFIPMLVKTRKNNLLGVQIMVVITERQQRPPIPPESELPGGTFPGLPAYLELMEACWHSQPEQRPPFEHCIITLRGLLEQAMAVK